MCNDCVMFREVNISYFGLVDGVWEFVYYLFSVFWYLFMNK